MKTIDTLRVKPFFRWYDLWVGVYWDRRGRAIYLCPLPTVGIKIYLDTIAICPQCGNKLQKTAVRDEGWILQWECTNDNCPMIDDVVEYIDWPFGNKPMNTQDLIDAGYEVF